MFNIMFSRLIRPGRSYKSLSGVVYFSFSSPNDQENMYGNSMDNMFLSVEENIKKHTVTMS